MVEQYDDCAPPAVACGKFALQPKDMNSCGDLSGQVDAGILIHRLVETAIARAEWSIAEPLDQLALGLRRGDVRLRVQRAHRSQAGIEGIGHG